MRSCCSLLVTIHIGELLEQISKNIAVQPAIIEQLCHCIEHLEGDINAAKVSELLQLDEAAIDTVSNQLTLVIGDTDLTISLTDLTTEIRAHLLPVLERANWTLFNAYIVTAENERKPVTFNQLYTYFDELDNMFRVSRFKGLAEMLPPELKSTCLNPATRTFMAITDIGDTEIIASMLGANPIGRKILVSEQ